LKDGHVTLGILMLDTNFPRIPGDVGNPLSYEYPVLLKTVPGATVQRVVYDADPSLLELFIESARDLQAQGADAITSSCGFLSLFQNKIAEAVSVPVFLSSLLQVPLVYAMTQRRVAILTANSERLTEEVLQCAGIHQKIPLTVSGLQEIPAFSDPILNDGASLQKELIEDEILARAIQLLEQYPETGAFVFECHNLAPYAKRVQQATGRPVFDIIDFANWIHSTLTKPDYPAPSSTIQP
jgi:Asp/Glu/hydantoin racemase